MSSPFRASDQSRSTPRSSPSRQRLNDSASRRLNGYHRGHRESLVDSPSRQLWEEFSRIVLDDDRNFNRSLDAQVAEQEKLHRQALDEALRQHEAVRESAERARERVELEIKREQARRAEAERQAVEDERRKLAEEDAERERERRRRDEDARRREQERKRQEDLRRQQEEQARQAEAQKQREEQEKAQRKAAQEKENADRKAREEAAARERQQQAQQPIPPPQPPQQTNGIIPAAASAPAPSQQQRPPETAQASAHGLVSSLEERKAVHKRYIDLWRRLKTFRETTEAECRKHGFKRLGDMKRTIMAKVGMINKHDKVANRQYLASIEAILKEAAQLNEPSVDITQYLVSGDPTVILNASDKRYPAVLLYLLHQLGKRAIKQLIGESGVDTEMADPLGILIIQIFARPDYSWNGQSVIDVLWAKYHVLCPQLFGINSREGSGNEYYGQVTGLSAGFSALTLRDFSKSRNKNPAPNRLWWESIARILNTPANEIQLTHYIIVKSLIEDFVPRILQIFGGAGLAVLRKAIRDFPQKGPRSQPRRPGEEARLLPEVMAVENMQVTLQQKYGLML